jgi:hypothetical protein
MEERREVIASILGYWKPSMKERTEAIASIVGYWRPLPPFLTLNGREALASIRGDWRLYMEESHSLHSLLFETLMERKRGRLLPRILAIGGFQWKGVITLILGHCRLSMQERL